MAGKEATAGAVEFEFDHHYRDLRICGQDFKLLVADVEALSAGSELSERLQAVDVTGLSGDAYRTLAAEITATIDQILGDGATARIIGDQRATVTGLVKLLRWLMEQAVDSFSEELDSTLADFTETVPED